MKKILFLLTPLFLITLLLLQCSKEKKTKDAVKSTVSKESFSSHLVTKAKGDEMIERYDKYIGTLIQNQFQHKSSGYISPYLVKHEIAPLIEYLTYLKQEGYTDVNLRYAAIDGVELKDKQGVPGLPYHTIVFYGCGKKENHNANRGSDEILGYYDNGTLQPPPIIKD